MHYTAWQPIEKPVSFHENRILTYDSEFVREKSYYPKLALIQLHQPDWAQAKLFDPLSHDSHPLLTTITQHPSPIVLHAGSQDLELMLASCGQLPKTIRDTQIAFALLTPHRTISYATLVKHYLGIEPDKAETRSDWLARPLTAAQCGYAADDVGLLSQVYPYLCADLAAKNRLHWWKEDCATLLSAQQQTAEPIHWYKLRSAPQQLRKAHLPAAEALVQIRETLAKESDLPRRRILSDEQLIKLALHKPKNAATLAEYLPETHQMLNNIALVETAFQATERVPPPPKPRQIRLNDAEQQRYRQLERQLHDLAKDLNLHPDTIANTRQLREYIATPETASIAYGWRGELLAQLK